MMNTSRKLLLAGAATVALTAVASSAFAQNSASATASASVTIIRPITISKTADLAFGRVVVTAPATASSLVVTPAGATGSPTNLTVVAGGTHTAAAFLVSGEGGQQYNITLPASAAHLSGSVGGNTTDVTVDTFTSTPSGSSTIPGSLGAGGSETVNVGGTVNIPANATADGYTGSFQVTVTYQ